MKKLLVLHLCVLLCLFLNATKYYISPSGSDTYNGLATTTPWRTIAKVNSFRFQPGDSILFLRGGVWREMLVPSGSGASGKPITYTAYGTGARPVINGANVYNTGWTLFKTNVWVRSSPLTDNITTTVRVQGVVYPKVQSIDSLKLNTFYQDKATNPDRVYIYSTVNPNTIGVELAFRRFGIFVANKGYLTFSHVDARNCTNSAIRFDASGYYDGYPGLFYNGYTTVDNVTTSNSVSYGFCTGNGYCRTTVTNSVSYANGNGYYADAEGNHTIFRRDTAYDNYNFLSPFTDGNGFGIYKSSFVTIEQCLAYNNKTGCGFEGALGHTDSALTVRYNVAYGNGTRSEYSGFWFGNVAGRASSNQISYNLSYNNGNDAKEKMGREFILHHGNYTFYNNTAYTTGALISSPLIIFGYGSVIAKNNILYAYGTKEQYCIRRYDSIKLTSERNLYYSSYATPFYWGTTLNNGTRYSFTNWKTFNKDITSLFINPLFVQNGSNFRLQSTSPAINKGVGMGQTRDLLGNLIVLQPDLGAYETAVTLTTSSISQGNITSAAEISENEGKLSVYPNPALQSLTIRLPKSKAATIEITVFDITGRSVMAPVIVDKPEGAIIVPLDVSKLPHGLYNINISISGQKSASATFMKVR